MTLNAAVPYYTQDGESGLVFLADRREECCGNLVREGVTCISERVQETSKIYVSNTIVASISGRLAINYKEVPTETNNKAQLIIESALTENISNLPFYLLDVSKFTVFVAELANGGVKLYGVNYSLGRFVKTDIWRSNNGCNGNFLAYMSCAESCVKVRGSSKNDLDTALRIADTLYDSYCKQVAQGMGKDVFVVSPKRIEKIE